MKQPKPIKAFAFIHNNELLNWAMPTENLEQFLDLAEQTKKRIKKYPNSYKKGKVIPVFITPIKKKATKR
jgi:hypothetical protein